MDDNPNQQPNPQSVPPQEQQPPPPTPSLFENNKVLYFVGAVFVLVMVLGFTMMSFMNNFQKENKAAKPTNTPTATIVPTQILSPTAEVTIAPTNTPVPVNPSNVKRKNDLLQIQFALQKYFKERGSYPSEITTTVQAIAKEGSDLCGELTAGYMTALPKDSLTEEDPSTATGSVKDCNSFYITGYTIAKDPQNKITLKAPYAEQETITITF
jgi:hypothetical protein